MQALATGLAVFRWPLVQNPSSFLDIISGLALSLPLIFSLCIFRQCVCLNGWTGEDCATAETGDQNDLDLDLVDLDLQDVFDSYTTTIVLTGAVLTAGAIVGIVIAVLCCCAGALGAAAVWRRRKREVSLLCLFVMSIWGGGGGKDWG